jgi:hypothetical protein
MLPAIPLERLTKNEMVNNYESFFQTYSLIARTSLLDRMIDLKHDIDRECGYPIEFTPYQYRRMYDREGIATRVVDIMPDECWAEDPELVESEGRKETKFEGAWRDLCDQHDIYHYLHRIDQLSGIGFYGVILIGFNDGKELWDPVDGIDEQGRPNGKADPNMGIVYLRAFDETQVRVQAFEQDRYNPRYATPNFYSVRFVDVTTGIPEAVLVAGNYFRRVHWSRIIHVADCRKSGEVFGVPRMRPVLNRLIDLRKLLGGSAEMFWKGAFPGYSFEIDPEIASEAEFDREGTRQELEAFQAGLMRYLPMVGMKAKSLAPQVASPRYHINEQLQAIAASIGCPLPLLLGMEEGKLASAMNKRTWNERMRKRQHKYLTPMLIKPFANRLIYTGVLPEPDDRVIVNWPDLNKPTDQDKANLGITRTQAIVQYVTSGAYNLVPPYEFFTVLLGMTPEQAEAILESGDFQTQMKKMNAQLLQGTNGGGGTNGKGKQQKPQKGITGTGPGSTRATAAIDASRAVARGIREASGGAVI